MLVRSVRSSRLGFAAGLLGLLALSSAPAQAQIYSNNFETNSTANFTGSGLTIGTRTDNGKTYLATSGTAYGFGAGTATLTLTGVAPAR